MPGITLRLARPFARLLAVPIAFLKMDRREWANYLRAFARDGRGRCRRRLLFAKLSQFFSEAPFSYGDQGARS